MYFTQNVKNQLIAEATERVGQAQAVLSFAQSLPVGRPADVARAARLHPALNGMAESTEEPQKKRRGRRKLSAAAKRHISERMKAKWAERKKAQRAK